MRSFLRNLSLLAAVTAAGGFALMKAASTLTRPAARSLSLMVATVDIPPRLTHSPISFEAMVEGEEIRVRYRSKGCFHDFEHYLVFTPDSAGGAALTNSTRHSDFLRERTFFRPSRLSQMELRQLDGLLKLYRTLGAEGGCTTIDTVHVALYRNGRIIAREKFVDATCGRAERDNSILTLDRLLYQYGEPVP